MYLIFSLLSSDKNDIMNKLVTFININMIICAEVCMFSYNIHYACSIIIDTILLMFTILFPFCLIL